MRKRCPRRLHPLDRALTSSRPALHDENAIFCRVGNDECRRCLADRPPHFGRGARTETAIFLGRAQQGEGFQSMRRRVESRPADESDEAPLMRERELTVPTEHGFEGKGGRNVLENDGTFFKGADSKSCLFDCDAVGRLAGEAALVAAAPSRTVLSLAGTLYRTPIACTEREAVCTDTRRRQARQPRCRKGVAAIFSACDPFGSIQLGRFACTRNDQHCRRYGWTLLDELDEQFETSTIVRAAKEGQEEVHARCRRRERSSGRGPVEQDAHVARGFEEEVSEESGKEWRSGRVRRRGRS